MQGSREDAENRLVDVVWKERVGTNERAAWKHVLARGSQVPVGICCGNGEFSPALCDSLGGGMGWEMGAEFRSEGTGLYLGLLRVDVWQKPVKQLSSDKF